MSQSMSVNGPLNLGYQGRGVELSRVGGCMWAGECICLALLRITHIKTIYLLILQWKEDGKG